MTKAKARDDGKIDTTDKWSIAKPVTNDHYERHLQGNKDFVLGIVPVNEEDMCVFGAIDVDQHNMPKVDIITLIKKIRQKKFPLIPCRAKSGGMHLYCHTKEPIPARVMKKKLRQFVSALQLPNNTEVFPKQSSLLEGGNLKDIGSWINIPYWGGDNTDRYAYNDVGEKMLMEEWIRAVDYYSRYEQELEAVKPPTAKEEFSDGMVCLSQMAASPEGFPPGTRDTAIFNLGIYFKKSHPDDWEDRIKAANKKYCRQAVPTEQGITYAPMPLDDKTMESLIKSVKRKGYHYQCNNPPLCNHCDRAACRLRKHGIGLDGMGIPISGTIQKHDTNPPQWIMDIEGDEESRRVCLTTEQFFRLNLYKLKVFESRVKVVKVSKQAEWELILEKVCEGIDIVKYDFSDSPEGRLESHLRAFCTGLATAREWREVDLGMPYTDRGLHWFKLEAFKAFLDRQKFNEIPHSRLATVLKQTFKAKTMRKNITAKRQVYVYGIPRFEDVDDGDPIIPEDIAPPDKL